jgi:hypothetical protein
MSTPEQPATPALTRKQLRDIRNTGATPIITGDPESAAEAPTVESESVDSTEPEADVPSEQAGAPAGEEVLHVPVVAAPLPRAALPVAVHDLPGADASVDLGVAPLTRRQARQQERIRTASVPVITPEVAAAHAAAVAHDEIDDIPAQDAGIEPSSGEVSLAEIFGTDAEASVDDDESVDQPDTVEQPDEDEHVADERVDEPAHDAEGDRAIVHPEFGAELLAGDVGQVELPPSFDQLITRSSTGSIGTGNALILSQTPSAPPLVGAVTATGEVLITGTFNLPEGLGSNGHAPGTADGKEVDAVLVDGELPAHSSPTPIAASAAISTIKSGGDIIKPPTPEKGGRLMLTLAITAGVLALALVGVLILAFVTGVF